MESNLINFSFATLPCFNKDSQGKTEEKIKEISTHEKSTKKNDKPNKINLIKIKENSNLINDYLEKGIANSSVSQTSFPQTSESSDLSKNGIQYYFSETIEYIKQSNPEKTTEYKKSKNFLLKKYKIQANNLKENKVQFMTVNCQLNLYSIIKLKDDLIKAIYIDPFLRYHCFYFPLVSIISSDNTENMQSISEDKKDDNEASEICSNIDKKEEPKLKEQEWDYKVRYPRKNKNKKFKNKKIENYCYKNRNNYYRSNNYNQSYYKNYSSYNYHNKLHKHEY